ncbi:MAG TPA: hypothetical protein VFU69_14525 [Ktedonobacterales bacterium]|nr:hypothetical protein [Ktedonobacterales bacterium]
MAHSVCQLLYTRTTEEVSLGVYGFERTSRSPRADVAFLPLVAGAALIGFQYAPDAPAQGNKGKQKKRLTGSALRHGRTRPRRAPYHRRRTGCRRQSWAASE